MGDRRGRTRRHRYHRNPTIVLDAEASSGGREPGSDQLKPEELLFLPLPPMLVGFLTTS